jgi:cysteinyl-tRNA synthetase
MTKFKDAISQDLNIPSALAVLHEVLGSDLSAGEKGATVMVMDEVFGLGLADWIGKVESVPAEITALAEARWQAKIAKDFAKSDELRLALTEAGWNMKDGKDGYELERI